MASFDHAFIEPGDFAASLRFYTEVLGWRLEASWGGDRQPRGGHVTSPDGFRLVLAEWHPPQGDHAKEAGIKGHQPTLHLRVPDVDAAWAALPPGPHRVQPPEDTHWGARWCVVQDPDGNLLAFESAPAGALAARSPKQAVLAYVEAFNRGDVDALCAQFAPDALVWGVLGWGRLEQVRPIWEELVAGLGIQLEVVGIVAEGDTVAVRYTERGTSRAPFRGQAATGRSYELIAMEWFTVERGLITRRWGARDFAAQSRQLGFPPPA